MPNQKVKWGRAQKQVRTLKDGKTWVSDEPMYLSKCGRYKIEKRMMANLSGRAGCFTAVSYLFTVIGTEISEHCDYLVDAKHAAEYHNDPNWEPAE